MSDAVTDTSQRRDPASMTMEAAAADLSEIVYEYVERRQKSSDTLILEQTEIDKIEIKAYENATDKMEIVGQFDGKILSSAGSSIPGFSAIVSATELNSLLENAMDPDVRDSPVERGVIRFHATDENKHWPMRYEGIACDHDQLFTHLPQHIANFVDTVMEDHELECSSIAPTEIRVSEHGLHFGIVAKEPFSEQQNRADKTTANVPSVKFEIDVQSTTVGGKPRVVYEVKSELPEGNDLLKDAIAATKQHVKPILQRYCDQAERYGICPGVHPHNDISKRQTMPSALPARPTSMGLQKPPGLRKPSVPKPVKVGGIKP